MNLLRISAAGGLTPLKLFSRCIKTSAVAASGKTPIQEYGYSYLKTQREFKRPLSPHLTIYEPQLTSMLSIMHRIFGAAIGVGALAAVSIVLASGLSFPEIIDWIRQLGLPALVVAAAKFTVAFPITYHYFNGIRFLGFELGKGIDLPAVYKYGYLVFALSIAVSLALVILCGRNEGKPRK